MRNRSAEATRRAGKRAVEPLIDLVQPWALEVLAAHRAEGGRLVLATTSPIDLVAPLAEALGFDDVIATRYAERTAATPGGWTAGSSGAWASGPPCASGPADNGVDLGASHAYSRQLLRRPAACWRWAIPTRSTPTPGWWRWPWPAGGRSSTGTGRRASPRWSGSSPTTWPARSSGPRPSPTPASTRRAWSTSRPAGPVLLAANHRSYFDVAAIGLVAARIGRPVRFMAKQEVFDAPVVGRLARALGGIPVERGSGSSDPMRRAAAALRAGEVVIVLPQGTIPRGEAFFDPVLDGHTGAARLAAETGAPVVPIGLWGTERVWPRSSKVPDHDRPPHPPRVTVNVGPPVPLGLEDAVADTAVLMEAIVDLLPDEARVEHDPHRRGPGPHPTPGVTVSTRPGTGRRSRPRAAVAVEALKLSNWLSRTLGRGSGTVAGGRVGLAIDPTLLATLAQDRRVALVTGTNGKTTTTRMLAAALSAGGGPPGGHQRHRGQHAGRPRGRPGRTPPGGPAPCSRSTRATSAG